MFKFLDDFILNFHLRKIQKYSKDKERGTAAKLWIYSHKKAMVRFIHVDVVTCLYNNNNFLVSEQIRCIYFLPVVTCLQQQ
jgi:hypothetical protein